MKFLRGRGRFTLYALALGVLGLIAALAVWGVAKTGAYLTEENDWQTLAGDYRIGIINYTVEIDGQLLLRPLGEAAETFEMLVPLKAGVRMFDHTVSAENRGKEFGEGVNLVRVRIVNRSDSTVDVNAAFFPLSMTPADHLRLLPVPTVLDEAGVRSLNGRQYALDTVGMQDVSCTTPAQETAALASYKTAYDAYLKRNPEAKLPVGILSGATGTQPTGGDYISEGNKFYFYRDVYFLLWSEYGEGEYNAAQKQPELPRSGRLKATFTVGQLD